MNYNKIEDIGKVNAGINIKRYESKKGKEYKVISLKSVKNNQINYDKTDYLITDKNINQKYFAKKGDVLLGLYSPYSSAYIENKEDNLIIPHTFAIIRTEIINPEYLTYYLNSDYTFKEINKVIKGSRNSKLTLNNIKELKIKELNDKEEEEYVEIVRLLNKQIKLKEEELFELKKIRRYYLNGDRL